LAWLQEEGVSTKLSEASSAGRCGVKCDANSGVAAELGVHALLACASAPLPCGGDAACGEAPWLLRSAGAGAPPSGEHASASPQLTVLVPAEPPACVACWLRSVACGEGQAALSAHPVNLGPAAGAAPSALWLVSGRGACSARGAARRVRQDRRPAPQAGARRLAALRRRRRAWRARRACARLPARRLQSQDAAEELVLGRRRAQARVRVAVGRPVPRAQQQAGQDEARGLVL